MEQSVIFEVFGHLLILRNYVIFFRGNVDITVMLSKSFLGET